METDLGERNGRHWEVRQGRERWGRFAHVLQRQPQEIILLSVTAEFQGTQYKQ